ncbi:lytic transglycosylase domain-containing protein [Pararhizobium sp. YC-54]|uniref:lytic transglycosylase domain-containing protein n=1 Tax=Pararhizobium sp. YC-54 TaxID=2986920 RepID=UPI0021F784B0|nr:lytic transglycosylase domain-containing protein [Pararhizobium sp. YC-54]MCW0001476.1 lytic transglycosylase domain-containing protein [Pararhizobium sp. YC-54]
MRSAILLLLSTALAATPAPSAWADVPVIDDDGKDKRSEDESHSAADKDTQADQLEEQTVTNCNISQKEKNRRLYRSPAQAVNEDTENVALIKHYAEKYDIPVGLALSVAHAESGISTCSGSPTGVKGVMQLTKRTGNNMGFDRDINEENIEGGVKYLGMGVNKCGSTDYACLASWYNGSTAAEQKNWAGKVGRNHAWFNAYAGGSNIEEIASPSFKSTVDYGSEATRNANSAAVSAVDRAVTGIDASTARVHEAGRRIDALSNSVGASEIYQDAWDDNTQARAVNSELLNNLIVSRNLFNELLQARLQMKLSKTSETAKSLKSDPKVNPYSCDPVILEQMKMPRETWPRCASVAAADGETSVLSSGNTDAAIGANLLSIQNAANAAD